MDSRKSVCRSRSCTFSPEYIRNETRRGGTREIRRHHGMSFYRHERKDKTGADFIPYHPRHPQARDRTATQS